MTVADARCYHWGVVLSKARCRGKGDRWVRQLLLHELLHWAGYGHDVRFRRAAKVLGTW